MVEDAFCQRYKIQSEKVITVIWLIDAVVTIINPFVICPDRVWCSAVSVVTTGYSVTRKYRTEIQDRSYAEVTRELRCSYTDIQFYGDVYR